ncbi:hypothetical protein MCOR27_009245 [Pyricularia oryzae]|uniref:Uncharacterized protein n=2 Tax=Pyricularia TaxID=48558 RepID=A0ABQ8N6R1_PYRGI|nr:hypothetical protein MCOR01_005106 [Pyricularia oryzae]KAI6292179.1 hypothetical protein MCOR33_010042 [Pyricularia grisea]KAI6256511.1 hypothetical protein MCOR19_007018 [Pyricularia oryzae]KAI6270564.1 hypothetical protein MCOR27_009245 [Pyricularia oryzae]KAI6270926.1 hypothetical protein MCOR26_008043 [Pyricularia oryzae]
MTEVWEAVAATRHHKKLSEDEAAALKESCSKAHQHQHIAQCAECCGRLLDQVATRYTKSPDMAWLTAQRNLPEDLEKLFARARQNPRELDAVERRLNDAKRDWARGRIQTSKVIRRLVEDAGHTQLLEKLQDESISLEAALGEIDNVLSGRASTTSARDLDVALEKLIAAQSNPLQRQEVHREVLNATTEGPLDGFMDQMLDRLAASKASKEIKDKHLRRLDELRRAQTAHLKSKKKKKSKNRKPDEGEKPPSLDVPPCTACATLPDPKSFISCTLCLVRSNACGQGPPAVFCTGACYEVGFDDHVNEAHICSSGDDCIQLRRADDEDMSGVDTQIVLCSDCLGPTKVLTSYCSETCAEMNFDRHQNAMHKHESPGQSGAAAPKNQSRNIDDHVVPLNQVLADMEQRNGITMKAMS